MKHNWEYKRLGEVCDKASSNLMQKDLSFVKNGFAVYGASGYLGQIENYSQEKPYIGIVKDGSGVGRVNLYPAKSSILGTMQYLLAKDCINNSYLTYVLKSLNLSKYVNGAAIPHIYFRDYKNEVIPVPPMELQHQIVAELDKINEVIEDCRNLLRTLDSLAQSLFYDFFGDPISNPKGWETKTLKDVCILKSGDSSANRLPEGNIPYVKVGDMNLADNQYGIITSSNFVDIGNKSKLLFPVGTTIFPKRGGAILTNKKRLTKVPICCDLNIMGAIPQNIHAQYLFFFFLLKDFSELVDGSTVPQINNNDIYPLKILVPPLELQEKFAQRIEQIDEQKKAIEETITNLQTLLDSRMDYWFN